MSGNASNMGAWRTPLPQNTHGLHFHHAQQPPRHYAQGGYMANGAGGPPHQPMPAPGAVPLLPNQGRVIDTGSIRILCVADVRGKFDPIINLDLGPRKYAKRFFLQKVTCDP